MYASPPSEGLQAASDPSSARMHNKATNWTVRRAFKISLALDMLFMIFAPYLVRNSLYGLLDWQS
jgi:hypothetical protein